MSNALTVIQVKDMLVNTRPQFEEMNLNRLDFNKELEFAMQIFNGSDYLRSVDRKTIENALVNIVLTGLTLNPVMKYVYLVPRKGKCCVDPSYMGLIKVLTDTGSVKSIRAGIVFSKEVFDIELGTNGFVKHKPALSGDKGTPVGGYSIAVLNDGSYHVEWMYWKEIMDIKARSQAVKGGKGSPWDTDENEMSRKTVVKRHWKYLPKSERAIMASQAIAFDDEINGIDFDKERANNQSSQPITASGTQTKSEFATQEDMDKINGMVDNPVLPARLFGGKTVKANFKTKINQEFETGKYPKEKVEKAIAALEHEIAWFTQNPYVTDIESEPVADNPATEPAEQKHPEESVNNPRPTVDINKEPNPADQTAEDWNDV